MRRGVRSQRERGNHLSNSYVHRGAKKREWVKRMHYMDAIWTLRKLAPNWSVPSKKIGFICHQKKLMLESKHVQEPIRIRGTFLDGLTYNWLKKALSHWLLPSFGEVIRNRTSGKSYAEEKCKIGKDEDFGSERCTDWRPAAVYWAQSGWERGFSMLSLCYGLLNCLVSVQRQWKDPSIASAFLSPQRWPALSSSPILRVWFGSLLSTKETPNNSTATEQSHWSDWPSYSVWKDSWLTLRLSLLTWIGILG